jgi:hypothetical protein
MTEIQPAVQEIAGVKCFAPALAQAEQTYPAEAFARLVELEANSFWFRSRNRIIGRVFRKYLQQPARPRVLEIGCGTGFVLAALQAQRRFDLVGAEQHVAGLVWMRERCRTRLRSTLSARSTSSSTFRKTKRSWRACTGRCGRVACSS